MASLLLPTYVWSLKLRKELSFIYFIMVNMYFIISLAVPMLLALLISLFCFLSLLVSVCIFPFLSVLFLSNKKKYQH